MQTFATSYSYAYVYPVGEAKVGEHCVHVYIYTYVHVYAYVYPVGEAKVGEHWPAGRGVCEAAREQDVLTWWEV